MDLPKLIKAQDALKRALQGIELAIEGDPVDPVTALNHASQEAAAASDIIDDVRRDIVRSNAT